MLNKPDCKVSISTYPNPTTKGKSLVTTDRNLFLKLCQNWIKRWSLMMVEKPLVWAPKEKLQSARKLSAIPRTCPTRYSFSFYFRSKCPAWSKRTTQYLPLWLNLLLLFQRKKRSRRSGKLLVLFVSWATRSETPMILIQLRSFCHRSSLVGNLICMSSVTLVRFQSR